MLMAPLLARMIGQIAFYAAVASANKRAIIRTIYLS